jgi:hypothetical protein
VIFLKTYDVSICLSLSSQFDLLEMDRLERPLVNLPLLLDPSSYVPDTVDLTDDALARKYWLTCFEEALDGVRGKHGERPVYL